jgi:thymidylate synthase (FAD)
MGMNQIKVELIDHMGSDLSVVNSARVSFDKEVDCVEAKDEKLIKYLADHRHVTPFRHNQIQIRCHAPIFLARQLGKHQAGLSWNEVSRRYVDSEPEFYIPDEWRGRPDGSIKQGSGEILPAYHKENYEVLIKHLLDEYLVMVSDNVAPEMARMVLPQSMMTSWYWTGNLLAFAHVYKERIAEGAQLEAQYFAKELDNIIRPLFPVSWAALVGDEK